MQVIECPLTQETGVENTLDGVAGSIYPAQPAAAPWQRGRWRPRAASSTWRCPAGGVLRTRDRAVIGRARMTNLQGERSHSHKKSLGHKPQSQVTINRNTSTRLDRGSCVDDPVPIEGGIKGVFEYRYSMHFQLQRRTWRFTKPRSYLIGSLVASTAISQYLLVRRCEYTVQNS